MSERVKQAFWAHTKRLTLALGVLWLAVNLAVPWFASELNTVQAFGFPLGYWLAAQGSLWVYLVIIVAYALAMDRLEARYLSAQERPAAEPPEAA